MRKKSADMIYMDRRRNYLYMKGIDCFIWEMQLHIAIKNGLCQHTGSYASCYPAWL